MRAYVHAEHRFHLHRREISTTGQKFVRPRRQVYQTVPKGNLKGRGPKRWSEGSAIFFRKRESLVSLEGLKLRLESRRRDTHGKRTSSATIAEGAPKNLSTLPRPTPVSPSFVLPLLTV